ncbi:hypothetical protein HK098_007577 [Nowakowskiella sp. JEL0407]|nr:hypothetical protein HK098_007577 [Nowakowskiella sp. JEL0407]
MGKNLTAINQRQPVVNAYIPDPEPSFAAKSIFKTQNDETPRPKEKKAKQVVKKSAESVKPQNFWSLFETQEEEQDEPKEIKKQSKISSSKHQSKSYQKETSKLEHESKKSSIWNTLGSFFESESINENESEDITGNNEESLPKESSTKKCHAKSCDYSFSSTDHQVHAEKVFFSKKHEEEIGLKKASISGKNSEQTSNKFSDSQDIAKKYTAKMESKSPLVGKDFVEQHKKGQKEAEPKKAQSERKVLERAEEEDFVEIDDTTFLEKILDFLPLERYDQPAEKKKKAKRQKIVKKSSPSKSLFESFQLSSILKSIPFETEDQTDILVKPPIGKSWDSEESNEESSNQDPVLDTLKVLYDHIPEINLNKILEYIPLGEEEEPEIQVKPPTGKEWASPNAETSGIEKSQQQIIDTVKSLYDKIPEVHLLDNLMKSLPIEFEDQPEITVKPPKGKEWKEGIEIDSSKQTQILDTLKSLYSHIPEVHLLDNLVNVLPIEFEDQPEILVKPPTGTDWSSAESRPFIANDNHEKIVHTVKSLYEKIPEVHLLDNLMKFLPIELEDQPEISVKPPKGKNWDSTSFKESDVNHNHEKILKTLKDLYSQIPEVHLLDNLIKGLPIEVEDQPEIFVKPPAGKVWKETEQPSEISKSAEEILKSIKKLYGQLPEVHILENILSAIPLETGDEPEITVKPQNGNNWMESERKVRNNNKDTVLSTLKTGYGHLPEVKLLDILFKGLPLEYDEQSEIFVKPPSGADWKKSESDQFGVDYQKIIASTVKTLYGKIPDVHILDDLLKIIPVEVDNQPEIKVKPPLGKSWNSAATEIREEENTQKGLLDALKSLYEKIPDTHILDNLIKSLPFEVDFEDTEVPKKVELPKSKLFEGRGNFNKNPERAKISQTHTFEKKVAPKSPKMNKSPLTEQEKIISQDTSSSNEDSIWKRVINMIPLETEYEERHAAENKKADKGKQEPSANNKQSTPESDAKPDNILKKLWNSIVEKDEVSDTTENYQEDDEQHSCSSWQGIDSTFDSWCSINCPQGNCPGNICLCKNAFKNRLVCADNRYVNIPGAQFLCQSSCNQPGFHCPKTHCQCETPEMEHSGSQCTSPRTCRNNEFAAVPGTIATDEWCKKSCTKKGGYCPCTLCECVVQCSAGIVNGDFSEGLAGWNIVRQTDSLGKVLVQPAGLKAPLSKKDIPYKVSQEESINLAGEESSNGIQTDYIALIDSNSPGSYVLYQEITPVRGDFLTFSWLASNYADNFYIQNDTMSANIYRNQQFRVDVIEPFSRTSTREKTVPHNKRGKSNEQIKMENSWENNVHWARGQPMPKVSQNENLRVQNKQSLNDDDVSWFDYDYGGVIPLGSILSPQKVKAVMNAVGSPPYSLLNPWQRVHFDLSPFARRKVWIAFRSVNNQGVMNVAIDDVSIVNKICTNPPSTPFSEAKQRKELQETIQSGAKWELGNPACGNVCGHKFSDS